MDDSFRPAFLNLLESGELRRRVEQAWQHLEACDLCARYCRVDRTRTVEGAVCRTGEVLRFLAREVSPRTCLNLMDQYHPCYRVDEYPPLDRELTQTEYLEALRLARRLGLRLDNRCEARWGLD